jgi:hypothetical protein
MIFYHEEGGSGVKRKVVKFLPDDTESSGTFHSEDPHKPGDTVQNLAILATWCPGYVRLWPSDRSVKSDVPTQKWFWVPFNINSV